MDSYNELISLCREAGGKTSYIGKTVLGYDIPLLTKGNEKKALFIGGIHAREYITAYLLIELFKAFDGAVAVVPLLNIDGTLLSRRGVDFLDERMPAAQETKAFLQQVNAENKFSQWKANLNAVDLNVNFPAHWGKGEYNVTLPSPANYIGVHPASEPETRATINLLHQGYKAVIAYHSKGEEVYYGFADNFEDKAFATAVGGFLDYEVKTTPNSCGGIKDYVCLHRLAKALTIEVAPDSLTHPVKLKHLPDLLSRHLGIMELVDSFI